MADSVILTALELALGPGIEDFTRLFRRSYRKRVSVEFDPMSVVSESEAEEFIAHADAFPRAGRALDRTPERRSSYLRAVARLPA